MNSIILCHCLYVLTVRNHFFTLCTQYMHCCTLSQLPSGPNFILLLAKSPEVEHFIPFNIRLVFIISRCGTLLMQSTHMWSRYKTGYYSCISFQSESVNGCSYSRLSSSMVGNFCWESNLRQAKCCPLKIQQKNACMHVAACCPRVRLSSFISKIFIKERALKRVSV